MLMGILDGFLDTDIDNGDDDDLVDADDVQEICLRQLPTGKPLSFNHLLQIPHLIVCQVSANNNIDWDLMVDHIKISLTYRKHIGPLRQ